MLATGNSLEAALLISLDAPPAANVTVSLSARRRTGIFTDQTASGSSSSSSSPLDCFFPNSIFFSSRDSLAGTAQSVLYRGDNSTEGDFEVVVTLAGASTAEYAPDADFSAIFNSGVAGRGRNFSIVHPDQQRPPPLLSSAIFSSSGAQLVVNFDRETDLAGASLGLPVPCAPTLLSFRGADKSLCTWLNSLTLEIQPGVIVASGSTGHQYHLWFLCSHSSLFFIFYYQYQFIVHAYIHTGLGYLTRLYQSQCSYFQLAIQLKPHLIALNFVSFFRCGWHGVFCGGSSGRE
jgi:hypothetical protein